MNMGKTGDINLDNSVDLLDFSMLADRWLMPAGEFANSDIDRIGLVDLGDMPFLFENWLDK